MGKQFKKGDNVVYKNRMGEIQGPYVVESQDSTGKVWFTTGQWGDSDRVYPWPTPLTTEAVAPASECWDYAEARRLKEAARLAIEAYNDYVGRQPTDVFISIINPL